MSEHALNKYIQTKMDWALQHSLVFEPSDPGRENSSYYRENLFTMLKQQDS